MRISLCHAEKEPFYIRKLSKEAKKKQENEIQLQELFENKQLDLNQYLIKYGATLETLQIIEEDVEDDEPSSPIPAWPQTSSASSQSPSSAVKSLFINRGKRVQETIIEPKKKRFSYIRTIGPLPCPAPGTWLNDEHINQALEQIKSQFPHVGGLIDTILFQSIFPINSNLNNQSIYILHINENHWLTLTNISRHQKENGLFLIHC